MNVRRLTDMVIVLAGIGLIAGAPEAVHAFGSLALVVFGTLSWGVAQALIRAWGRDDGSTIIGSVTLYATPQLVLASLALESGQLKALRTATLLDWSAVLTLAVGGFVVSYSIWYGLMRRYRVDQVTPFALLMPLAGVVFGAVLFGEQLSTRALVGGLVVMSGLAFILKESTAGRKPSTAEM